MAFINLPEITTKTALWANRPSADSAKGEVYYFTDIGPNGSSWISNGEFWSPVNGEVVLASSGVSSSVTGTTSETSLAAYTVPAGLMSRIGQFDLVVLTSNTNNANLKTFKIRLADVGVINGVSYYIAGVTSVNHMQLWCSIRANNSLNAQKGFGATGGTIAGIGTINAGLITGTRNMNQACDITLTGQLANSSDTASLRAWTIVYKG
jgi:hypothetical protein